MKRFGIILFGLGLSTLGHVSMARADDASVNISADEMEVFDAEHKTIFKGNVVADRTAEHLEADQMTVMNVDAKQDDGTTKSVTDTIDARGHVTITTKSQTITGEACLYHVRSNTMTVTGNVVITQGKNLVRGQKLDLDLNTSHLQMSGGRVQGSFVPK